MLLAPSVSSLFTWPQFEPEVILLAVGWYRRFSLSYRDVEQLLAERDLLVGPSLSGGGFNAPELNRRVRKGQSKKTVALGRIEVVFYAMTQKICTYCDEPVTTVGHVPPKCFFSNPLPSDLITFRRALNATHNGLNWMGSLAIIGYCSGPIEPVSRISAQHVDQECPVRSTIWIRLI